MVLLLLLTVMELLEGVVTLKKNRMEKIQMPLIKENKIMRIQ